MIRVKRTDTYLAHKGTKGMKWGYNNGTRNGKRTKAELSEVQKKMEEMASKDDSIEISDDIQADYDEANNMLKYLGITLDLQSDDEAVVRTMQIYRQMAQTKDDYENQYDWLSAFTSELSSVGYDMTEVNKYLDDHKEDINKISTGAGSGPRATKTSKKATTKKTTTKKESSSSKKKSETTSNDSSSKKKDSSSSKSTTSQVKRKSTSSYLKPNKKSSTTKSEVNKTMKHNDSISQNGIELYHHGILGQKWGVRRYQNKDGSLTSEGRKRYGVSSKGSSQSPKKYSKKRAGKMSDSEIDAATNRLRKENEYKKVSKDHSTSKDVVDKIQTTAIVATAIGTIYANRKAVSSMVQVGAKAVSKVLTKA